MTDSDKRTQPPRQSTDRDDDRSRFEHRVRKIIDEKGEPEKKPAR